MPTNSKKDFLILYGSQTGQAEAISEEIFDQAHKEGFNPARFCLSQIEKKFSIEKESCVVFVCSTTGEGEPPDTASKFVRRIKKKTLSSRFLQNLSYAFLALGDSNYTNFCECGKTIDQRLKDLGGTQFYDTGHADDAVGLEVVVEPWIEGLFNALKTHLNKLQMHMDSDKKPVDTVNNIVVDLDSPSEASLKRSHPPLCSSALKVPSSPDAFLKMEFLNSKTELNGGTLLHPSSASDVMEVTIDNARYLTSDTSVKTCLELELDIHGTDFHYEPGDSFGIVCENMKEDVEYLIRRLKIEDIADHPMLLQIVTDTKKKSPKIPDHIHQPSTLRNILKSDLDFHAVPRKAFLRMLVDYTQNESERRRLQELCSTQGAKDYGTFIREQLIGLVELLKTFESCSPPIERVLELLPRLLPREYSVACSQYSHPNHLKFVFNVIEHPEFQSNKRYGLCTKWLQNKCAKNLTTVESNVEERLQNLQLDKPKVHIYMRCPTSFRFPEDASRPLIMIGPGTGVAPYIGFLQHREYLKNKENMQLGDALLFFGCRHSEKDFLYKNELNAFMDGGILTRMFTSFSREESRNSDHTRYVQENIKNHKELVLQKLFEEKAAVYICGDAKHMGRDVTNTFVELIEEYKQITKLDALKLLAKLRTEKQFLEDVWT